MGLRVRNWRFWGLGFCSGFKAKLVRGFVFGVWIFWLGFWAWGSRLRIGDYEVGSIT